MELKHPQFQTPLQAHSHTLAHKCTHTGSVVFRLKKNLSKKRKILTCTRTLEMLRRDMLSKKVSMCMRKREREREREIYYFSKKQRFEGEREKCGEGKEEE